MQLSAYVLVCPTITVTMPLPPPPPTIFFNSRGNISFYVPNTLMWVTGSNSKKNNFASDRGVSYLWNGMVLHRVGPREALIGARGHMVKCYVTAVR